MTELERQLTKALRRLSAQYERDQKEHAAGVASLRRQVERLRGDYRRLGDEYGRLAVDYRRIVKILNGL